jgi:mono/diheme cytochrome c family protein
LRLVTFIMLLCLGAVSPAVGQQAGDPAAGLALAGEICSDCHSIEAGEAVSPVLDAPSFQAIANKPEISELALTVFFQTPHPSMPNLIVTGDDADNLVAYLLSLKP